MDGAVRLKISIIGRGGGRGGVKHLFEIEGKKELKGLIWNGGVNGFARALFVMYDLIPSGKTN